MQRAISYFKKLSLFSWLGICLLFIAASLSDYLNKRSPQDYITAIEKSLHKKEIIAEKQLNDYYVKLKTQTPKNLFSIDENENNNFKEDGIAYLVYQNDSLLYWSDNSASVEEYMKEVCLDNSIAKLKNGYYEVVKHSIAPNDRYKLLSLILIKNEYSYQNKYLKNNFFKDYEVPEGTLLQEGKADNNIAVKNRDGKELFYLGFQDQFDSKSNIVLFVSILLHALVFGFLLLLLKKEYFKYTEHFSKNSLLLFYTLSIIGLRAIMILNQFPTCFYNTGFYNPTMFGNADSFWFGFLGDILINTVLFFLIALQFQRKFALNTSSSKLTAIYTFVGIILLAAYSILINTVINSLVENSNISFQVNDFFSLDAYSFISFVCVGFFFFSYYLLVDKFVEEIIKQKIPLWLVPSIIAVTAIILYLTKSLHNETDLIRLFWGVMVISMVTLFKWKKTNYSFSNGLLFIVVFSLITSHLFYKNEKEKEIETRKIYADRLADQQDAVAENLFIDITKNIKNDVQLKNLVFRNPIRSLDIEQRLRQVYLGGYWERYNIGVSLFDSVCRPLITTTNPYYENNSYFDEQINLSGAETVCDDLFYIQNMNDRLRYVAKIALLSGTREIEKPAFLYFEIEPKNSPDVIGFPELLLDKSVKTNSVLSDYSYAIYKNNRLLERSGKYAYGFNNTWKKTKDEYLTISDGGFYHLIYFPDDLTTVVISKEISGLWERFTTNSYFFMFFSLILWVFLYSKEWQARKKEKENSLNLRIQLLLVSVVLVCLFSFGLGTFIFINKQFEEKNTSALDEKTRSVLQDLQAKLGEQDTLPENFKDYTGYILKKLSVVFATDITMFDLKGNMFASSQPRLFNEGIISKKMNPQAYNNIIAAKYTNIVNKENVGELNYYSAYQPFYNKNGKLLAYVNLPYFAKQNDLEKELSIYIVALVNIYVILFAFSTIAALFISNLVTKPLRIIQQRLSNVRIGKRNEPIMWNEKDEIGKLVNEYNRMIEQLEESVQKLAKSERESAWREMAKQVAHEIKNPLTPMKLSVQHLQRTSSGDPEEMKERIDKLSKMLIEQIDALSNIASEFSSFAKMPTPNIELVCINELVKNCSELFKETENSELIFIDKTQEKYFVEVDKDQCVRVCTNLIKNAQQSIPESRMGKIEIALFIKNKQIILKVKDNGTGIAPEAMDKIFVPNFSTKSEGMGLGLAMVKNIVESFDGKIWFETAQNVGTSFYVSLPIKSTAK